MTARAVETRILSEGGSPVSAFLPVDAAGHKNMIQLIELRWLAVVGQLLTIALTRWGLGIALPLVPMAIVLGSLVALNLVSLVLLKWRRRVTNVELFVTLLLDVIALSVQFYLSGGATNPFISLFLLQVVLGSILLERWSTWVIVVATSIAFALLTVSYHPLALPPGFGETLFGLHIRGMWVCFALVAVLLVMFVGRITANLRARDEDLADIRQQTTEQDHIVRIGLLASGAAHELGTPLSSLSVILGDWRRIPRIAEDAQLVQEIGEMQAEVLRCKAIVTSILLAAGEARGEASAATTVHEFLDGVFSDWITARGYANGHYLNSFGPDLPIVSDTVLQQVLYNVLDNAAEASPDWLRMNVARDGDTLVVTVCDHGPGFAPEMLERLGKPYQSSKARLGSGLGLFLVVNVMRKLDGTVTASNRAGGGAEILLTLPLSSLALAEDGDAD